jgi:Ethanolamine utilization protein EutJ (predicted chaperonin)
MKLFQIEEPDGTPLESDGPGAAVGIELSVAAGAAVAIAIGGNAELLPGADGAARIAASGLEDVQAVTTLLLRLRERAEKTLARPVTHAVVALAAPGARAREVISAAAAAAGLVLLQLMGSREAAARAPDTLAADAAVLGAAIQAEDDAAPPAR